MHTSTTPRPLASALASAIEWLEAAEILADEHEPEQPIDIPETQEWEAEEARPTAQVLSAMADVAAAREALEGSDEPREWVCSDDGGAFMTVTAASADDAAEEAMEGYDRADYPDGAGTIYVSGYVECLATGERQSYEVALDEPEPQCVDGHDHDWRSPYSVLGGLKENPGVWGHGGGAIIRQVCAHCGRYQITDTWAQRPDTGEQGLTAVTYEEPDAESLAWIERRAAA